MRPTRKQYEELKGFKLRVWLETHNALQLCKNEGIFPGCLSHKVRIGNTEFIFYPRSKEYVDELIREFTTDRW